MIDVAGGDKVPRKGGPGITGSDCLVINKVSRGRRTAKKGRAEARAEAVEVWLMWAF